MLRFQVLLCDLVWDHLLGLGFRGLVCTRDHIDMESQLVTVDQFTSAISSIWEAIARLGQRDGQPHVIKFRMTLIIILWRHHLHLLFS